MTMEVRPRSGPRRQTDAALLVFRPARFGLLLAAACSVGCGFGDSRVDLHGKATYDGQPVPGGRILFTPDKSEGNQGTATVADIVDGQYRTRPGKGAAPGAYEVTIYGTDSTTATETHDNSLFPPFQTTLLVSVKGESHDFDIPRLETTPAPSVQK